VIQIRVLIVDDDVDLAEGLAEMLRANDCEVDLAHNGQEAVERYRQRDYDIAFLDVRMPVMNGVEGFFAIKRLRPDAVIVMMTGFQEAMLQRALDAGALGPLNKPFSLRKMLDMVAAVRRSRPSMGGDT
jgi:DNA-binding response OmpR family regulator